MLPLNNGDNFCQLINYHICCYEFCYGFWKGGGEMGLAGIGLSLFGGIVFIVALSHISFIWMGIGVVFFVVGIFAIRGGG